MGKNERGKRDGTGPYKDSFQAQTQPTGKLMEACKTPPKGKSKVK